MAEALAFGASIIGVIQLADRVIDLSKSFIDQTSDAPAALRMAHAEASHLKDILEGLKNHQHASDTMNMTAPRNAINKPIKECHASMEELEQELARLSFSPSHLQTAPTKRQKVKRALRWAAGGEEKVKKLLTSLITEKATLSLALLADISEDVKNVKSTVEKLDRKLSQMESLDILRWLEHTNPGDIHNRSLKLFEEHTGQWALRCEEWLSFLHGEYRAIWLNGIPGAGKTVLASHLVDKLQDLGQRYKRTGAAYYYCYFGCNQDETEPFLR